MSGDTANAMCRALPLQGICHIPTEAYSEGDFGR